MILKKSSYFPTFIFIAHSSGRFASKFLVIYYKENLSRSNPHICMYFTKRPNSSKSIYISNDFLDKWMKVSFILFKVQNYTENYHDLPNVMDVSRIRLVSFKSMAYPFFSNLVKLMFNFVSFYGNNIKSFFCNYIKTMYLDFSYRKHIQLNTCHIATYLFVQNIDKKNVYICCIRILHQVLYIENL